MPPSTLDCLLLHPTRAEQRLKVLRNLWKAHEQISLQAHAVAQIECSQQAHALANQIDRFDVVLLLVGHDELAWSRTLLADGQPLWARPVMLLADNLHPAAIHDLLWLGAADFADLHTPFGEVLVRCRRLHHQRLAQRGVQRHLPDGPNSIKPSFMDSGTINEPDFNAAKRAHVQSFERKWLLQMLSTYRGNVTHAARASGKNRRAFWALLQKHQLSAAPFRPQ